MTRYDVAVVGAGPAGLAATASAVGTGARVVLLDAGVRPGGQYWLHRLHFPPVSTNFSKLTAALAGVDYRSGASVWFAEPGFRLHTNAGEIGADRLIVAAGAHDRVLPFPGWDLPGVVTAGGAQALLKGHGVLVGHRIVVAGTGPFLLPVAAGLARAGARIAGVFEANSPLPLITHLPPARAFEATRYAATFARHRIPYRTRHTVIAAHGSTEVEAVTVARPNGTTRRIACDTLAIGYGFVPALELPTLLGCATRVDTDTNLVVTVDHTQQTSVPGVYAAGEITGIGGAHLAIVEGTIAGLGTAPAHLSRRRARLRAFAAALHAAHPVPARWPSTLTDDTVICRCEEVRHHTVREAVTTLGATDARTVKLLTRTGMGWCQARICGYPVACLTAHLNNRALSAPDLDTFARRPLAHPITLAELADLPQDQQSPPDGPTAR